LIRIFIARIGDFLNLTSAVQQRSAAWLRAAKERSLGGYGFFPDMMNGKIK
jgi:hypothetical protein